MEPEGSLLHSEVPTTCLYPEPDRSSPCPHIPLPEWSILILFSHLQLGLPSGLLPTGFPTKTLYMPLLYPHTCYMPRPSHSSWFNPLPSLTLQSARNLMSPAGLNAPKCSYCPLHKSIALCDWNRSSLLPYVMTSLRKHVCTCINMIQAQTSK